MIVDLTSTCGLGVTVTVPLEFRCQLFEVVTVTVYVVVTAGLTEMLEVVCPPGLHEYVTPEPSAAKFVTVAVNVTGAALLQITAEFTPTSGLNATLTVPPALVCQLFEVVTVTVYVVVTAGLTEMLDAVYPPGLHEYVTPLPNSARFVTVAVNVTGPALLQIIVELTPTCGFGGTATGPLAQIWQLAE